jgi:4-hydroxy-tetrahydrodipicolinate synthase
MATPLTSDGNVGATNVRDAVTPARHAEGAGAAKVISMVPYHFHHTRESIKLYFERLVQAVGIHVYAYNNPKFAAVAIDALLLQELADLGVAGVKDSSFDIMTLANVVYKIPRDP